MGNELKREKIGEATKQKKVRDVAPEKLLSAIEQAGYRLRKFTQKSKQSIKARVVVALLSMNKTVAEIPNVVSNEITKYMHEARRHRPNFAGGFVEIRAMVDENGNQKIDVPQFGRNSKSETEAKDEMKEYEAQNFRTYTVKISDEVQRELKEAVEDLPEKYRRVFYERLVNKNSSCRDAAAALGITPKDVCILTKEGLPILKKKLGCKGIPIVIDADETYMKTEKAAAKQKLDVKTVRKRVVSEPEKKDL